MKSFRLISLAALVLLAAACGKNTRIEGILHEGAELPVIVKLLDVNRFQVLDTVKTDAAGAFHYALDLEEGQPEFIYLFYGDRQIASLLLQKGDHVQVATDTLGAYSVEGSEETRKLQKVENAYNAFLRDVTPASYVKYYRDRVAYVMGNSHSLTVVPVLFQQVTPALPVFGQPTDGILMRAVCDSLKENYPESRYVKALEKEAERRIQQLDLSRQLESAPEVGYLDITLPGIDGKPVTLSEVSGKVTMLYFWSSTAEQKMFNLDALVPIYEEFHPKGFELYAVSLDSDKTAWATAVRNQKLPWVNVCDTRGAQSPYVGAYGIGSLPMAWLIADGVIDPNAGVRNAADIRNYLKQALK